MFAEVQSPCVFQFWMLSNLNIWKEGIKIDMQDDLQSGIIL
jgi:hypothetical protein